MDHHSAARAVKPCTLCGHRQAREMFVKFGYSIVACTGCGLQYLDLEMSPTQLEAFYDKGYFTGDPARQGYLDYAGDQALLAGNFRHKLTRMARLMTPGRLLDIGAACGFFLVEAQRAGWHGMGLEVSAYACEVARSLGQTVVIADSLDAIGAEHTFDAITMWDVIEHLNDPLATVQEAHSRLQPGGWLVVSTGDVGHPLARILGRHCRMYAPPQHLFFFTRTSLRRLLEKAGFEVVRYETEVKVVTLHYVLHVIRGLVDHAVVERVVDWLRPRLPNLSIRLVLPDAMIVYARRPR